MDEITSADYLVIGAGAMGMAFVDTILTDSDRTVAIVDPNPRPGGHWTSAYPYVRLHQPATFYGVNSTPLGSDRIDQDGWNRGLVQLASYDEICAYYDKVMKEIFLPSGRVQYFPQHAYIGGGKFRSVETNKIYRAGEQSCIVDATYSRTEVPSLRPPPFEVARGVDVVAPNELPRIHRQFARYTVVGAGKTGIDACLWLLENGVDQHRITWIMPRDAYFFDREAFQPGPQFAARVQARAAGVRRTVMAASSIEDLLRQQVDGGQLLQLDDTVRPTMFHCATISQPEYEAIRTIESVVRKGRVTRITQKEVVLENGSYEPEPDTLYVDCAANAISKRPAVPIFEDGNIVLQPVRVCQQAFSAALIAHVEVTYDNNAFKNKLCRPVPMPDEPIDYPLVTLQTNINTAQWFRAPKTLTWVRDSRLNIYGGLSPPLPEDPGEQAALVAQLMKSTEEVSAKLCELLLESPHRMVARQIYKRLHGADGHWKL